MRVRLVGNGMDFVLEIDDVEIDDVENPPDEIVWDGATWRKVLWNGYGYEYARVEKFIATGSNSRVVA